MSQQLKVYNINAFTDKKNQGNPACVIQLKKWIDDKELLKISRINAVPETAFFIINKDSIHLRYYLWHVCQMHKVTKKTSINKIIIIIIIMFILICIAMSFEINFSSF